MRKLTTRKPTSKGSRYKVKNWNEYTRSLKNRGSITLWLSEDVRERWYYKGKKQKGSQYRYSNSCIEACCMIRKVYRLALRQTEGLVESFIKLIGFDVAVPNYTVICRRSKKLKISQGFSRRSEQGEHLHIVMDSTGLKVYGEGEWKVRQHGYSKYRTWRKIHIAVDPLTGLIHASMMSTNSSDDGSMAKPVLEKIHEKIEKFGADGAYDVKKVYEVLEKRKIKPIIPPRKGARIGKHGNCRGRAKPRDRTIRYIRMHGKKKWKKDYQYHKRSIAENVMFRLKTIFGDKLQSRLFETQCVETAIACKILNKMNRCGMPESVKVN